MCHRPLQIEGYLDLFTVGILTPTVRQQRPVFFFSRAGRNMSILQQQATDPPLNNQANNPQHQQWSTTTETDESNYSG